MVSVKKNFLYSGFLTSANLVFPLLVFPYVTRVLGVNNLGICDFVDSIVNYFILLSSMGIATVGIREIAAMKSAKAKLSKTFLSLLSLNAIFTIVAVVALVLATIFVPKLNEHRDLMFFGGFKIIFNFLLIEWFYKGLEDFRYITIRTLAVKVLYIIAIFIFVKEADDYPAYYLLSVLMIGVNAIINITHSKKYITFALTNIDITLYLTPFLIYGIYFILTSFYTTFNIAYLGFVTDTVQVGLYTTATKLFAIFIAIFSAFTGVMLPRMSSLLKEGKIPDFKLLYGKSIDILSSIAIPAIILSTITAPELVTLMAGPGFAGAILPMRIVIPLFFVIGYEQILVIQALMPLKKDKAVLFNSFIGACVGILANLLLVRKTGAVGAAVVWVSCETVILILSQIAVKKTIQQSFPFRLLAKRIIAYLPLAVLIYFISSWLNLSNFAILLITSSITLGYFIIINLFIFPDSTSGELLTRYLLFKKNKK